MKYAFLALAAFSLTAAIGQKQTPKPQAYDTWEECYLSIDTKHYTDFWIPECELTQDNKWRVSWVNLKRGW